MNFVKARQYWFPDLKYYWRVNYVKLLETFSLINTVGSSPILSYTHYAGLSFEKQAKLVNIALFEVNNRYDFRCFSVQMLATQ